MEKIGASKTREILTRFGYQNGYADFFRAKLAYQFDDEMNLLASGPVIHTWEGIVRATPTEIRFDRKTGEMYFTGVWENSYECEQFLCYHGLSADPVCWSVTGYASGWTTAFFGRPVLAMEPVCRAKGDPNCGWLIQPPDKFGPEARPFVEALKDFWESI